MDIYKLSDFNEDKPQEKLKITDIRQAVKNENRVNVFVDGKYSFSLDVAQVVDLGIKVGQEISDEKLEEFKKASGFGKLYQRTLEWVLARPRSIRETRDYIFRKLKASSSDTLPVDRTNSSEEVCELSEEIISRLLRKNYLNDEVFAKWYVENRFVKKGISQKRLKMELIKKGISGEIIDEVLSGRNDEEEIKKIIAKKRGKYTDEKLIQYLCRQGFSYQLVQNLVLTYEKD